MSETPKMTPEQDPKEIARLEARRLMAATPDIDRMPCKNWLEGQIRDLVLERDRLRAEVQRLTELADLQTEAYVRCEGERDAAIQQAERVERCESENYGKMLNIVLGEKVLAAFPELGVISGVYQAARAIVEIAIKERAAIQERDRLREELKSAVSMLEHRGAIIDSFRAALGEK